MHTYTFFITAKCKMKQNK